MLFTLAKKFYYGIRNVSRVAQIQEELDALRCKLDLDDALLDEFQSTRRSPSYQSVFDNERPLVSVCVATYNRAELVTDRCIRSILEQDYGNLEVIVVGDCCTDATAELISGLADSRLRFINLPERGRYPEEREWRWMVAGTVPMNHALSLVRGDFVAHLDDDDRYAPDRIGKLVRFAQQQRADLVWHPFWQQTPSGGWVLNPSDRLIHGQVTTSVLFYHRWFARIPWDINAYKYREPGDYNRLRKIKYLGAHGHRFPEPLAWHYRERAQVRD